MNFIFLKYLQKNIKKKKIKYFLIFAFLTISNCLHKIELYRLNSYKINENIFGPKFSKFNLQLTHYKTKQLLRKATFLLFQDLQKPNLFTNMLAYKPGAIIIICPVYFNDDILQNKIWEQLFQQICIFLNFSKNKKKNIFFPNTNRGFKITTNSYIYGLGV